MTARARIFVLDDEALVVAMLARALERDGWEVRGKTDPAGAVEDIEAFAPALVLLDLKLPGTSGLEVLRRIKERGIPTQVAMLSSEDSAESAVRALKLGAVHYFTKPFDLDELRGALPSLLTEAPVGAVAEAERPGRRELVGASGAMRALQEQAARLAHAGVPVVLITGENGTGKEMLARYTHELLQRREPARSGPFIGINCAALPEPLIESELFGHDRGAFTDARAEKKGVFELASGGSILLDEIGEMKWDLQAKLLRVLEEWKVRRVGGTHETAIDATVFATTNRDLDEAVRGGAFRIDLFYRLATFSLHVPPLRERPEDILPLAHHFLATYGAKYHRPAAGLSPDAERLLLAYHWPGNVRELRNMVERIVVLEAGPIIMPGHLPPEILANRRREPARPEVERGPRCAFPAATAAASTPDFELPEGGLSIEDLRSTLIVQALARTGRNKAHAAKLLGVTYDSLRYQMKKLGL